MLAASSAQAQTPSQAQSLAPLPANPSAIRLDPPLAPPANAVAAAMPLTGLSSSEKVRENPGVQYLLIKTVVGQSIGVVEDAGAAGRAEGYNLLKYCWTVGNVLGDWAEQFGPDRRDGRAGAGNPSWARDLERGGYPEAPVARRSAGTRRR